VRDVRKIRGLPGGLRVASLPRRSSSAELDSRFGDIWPAGYFDTARIIGLAQAGKREADGTSDRATDEPR